jgi:lipoyl(octanoyl) transferase
MDVLNYVRRLEQSLISVCAGFEVEAGRVEGRSGVWLPATAGLPERKIAAIGIRVARGIALHGFALNCDCDLSAFSAIVPCGIADAGVTSLSAELGRRVGVADVRTRVAEAVCDALDGRLAVTTAVASQP